MSPLRLGLPEAGLHLPSDWGSLRRGRMLSEGDSAPARSWRGKWQPIPIFLPGKSHGQRSLVGYNSWGHKELDTI